jgi:hypothetical protein
VARLVPPTIPEDCPTIDEISIYHNGGVGDARM